MLFDMTGVSWQRADRIAPTTWRRRRPGGHPAIDMVRRELSLHLQAADRVSGMPTTEPDKNPPYGTLPGMQLADVAKAIELSGYPLQADVMNIITDVVKDYPRLMPTYQEEWAYIDSDSGEGRSIDIYALLVPRKRIDKRTGKEILTDDLESSHFAYDNVALDLLIECKQSDMPYVFFLRDEGPPALGFPLFAGIRHPIILVHNPEDDVPGIMPVRNLLGLYELPFFNSTCQSWAVSISKIARRGSKLELTGDESYRALTLPLMKAARHFKKLCEPGAETNSSRIYFVICIAVLRAPMFGTSFADGEQTLTPIPWVRVWRVEPSSREDQWLTAGAGPGTTIHYMDAVHESYLRDYLTTLFNDFGVVVERHEKLLSVIAEGLGIDPTYGEGEPYQSVRPLTPAEKDRIYPKPPQPPPNPPTPPGPLNPAR